jgi:hypothetical protein
MLRIFLLCISLSILAIGLACGGPNGNVSTGEVTGGGGASPTDAYKQLYAAVKAKDIEAIKRQLTNKTIEFGAMAAQRGNTPVEKMYENGFTATTFSETLPEIRDERIKDDMGALEVWNSKENKWEDLPFMKEDGGWKLAVGDLFANTYKSPGRGLDALAKEAANNVAEANRPANNSKPAYNAPIEVKKGPPLDANMAVNANK